MRSSVSLTRFRLRAAVVASFADFWRVRASGGASERGRPSLSPTSSRCSARLASYASGLESLLPFFFLLPMERSRERAFSFGVVVDGRDKKVGGDDKTRAVLVRL